jgi:hypothetical protein
MGRHVRARAHRCLRRAPGLRRRVRNAAPGNGDGHPHADPHTDTAGRDGDAYADAHPHTDAASRDRDTYADADPHTDAASRDRDAYADAHQHAHTWGDRHAASEPGWLFADACRNGHADAHAGQRNGYTHAHADSRRDTDPYPYTCRGHGHEHASRFATTPLILRYSELVLRAC